MKLKSKKTGKIIKLSIHSIAGKNYESLAEINEDWEDAEPKDFWYIEPNGVVLRIDECACCTDSDIKLLKEIGNYFETKEEAEKAVEKLKAWKRLKDTGFRFIGKTCEYKSNKHFGSVFFEISRDLLDVYKDNIDFYDDLDLLFGGEDYGE